MNRPILLLPVFLALGQVSSSMFRWPVFFEHLGQVHNEHNRFDLSLRVRIHLPALERKVKVILKKLDLLGTEFRDPDVISQKWRKRVGTRLEELHDSWRQQNSHLRERCDNQLRRARDLRELGEYYGKEEEDVKTNKRKPKLMYFENLYNYNHQDVEDLIQSSSNRRSKLLSRKKRQLLKGLLGLAYSADIDGVIKKVEEVDSKLTTNVNEVRSKAERSSASTKNSIERQGRELKTVEKMAEKLERKVVIMETNPFMKTSISDLVHMRNEAYKKLSLEVDLCEERLVEVEATILALGSGRLSKFVISPAKLRETLIAIQQQLPENFALLYDSMDALWPYYSTLPASARFDADLASVLVTVKIPLRDAAAELQLHRVHNLPVKVKDGYSVIADVDTEYIVTDRDRQFYLELNKQDFQDCREYKKGSSQRHFYCGLSPLLRADRSRSCLMDLFSGIQDSAWCQSKLKHGSVQPFQRLNNGSWIFAAVSEQIPVTLECPDKSTPTALVGFGVLSLAEGCTITADEFHYAHTFAGSVEVNAGFGGDTDEEQQQFFAENRQGSVAEEEDEDEFAHYDVSRFADDPIYDFYEEEDEKATVGNHVKPTKKTTTTTTTTKATTTEPAAAADLVPPSRAEVGLQVEQPLNKHATEVYKNLLVRLKDTFAHRWQLVRK